MVRETMVLGIIVALPAEARCFSRAFREKGKIYRLSHNALLIISGMGEGVNQAAAMLHKEGVSCLVSCGTAAGLVSDLKSGMVCIPQAVVNSHGEVYQSDHVVRSQVLLALANQMPISQGRLAHTENILVTSEAKRQLHQVTSAISSDMESFLIAALAQHYQLRFLALRVIIDTVDVNVPNDLLQCMSSAGAISISKLLWAIGYRPALLKSLIVLAKNYYKVRKQLKIFSKIEVIHSIF